MLTIGSSFSDLRENCCAVQNEENETIFRLCSLDTSIPDLIFRSRRRNQIRSICFSSDFSAAIVQQDDAILDFLILTNGNVSAEFQQPPKFFKDASFIIGFNWLADRQLAIITDAGVEFCSLNVHRKSLKLLKSFAHSTSWFICFPDSKLFLFACGAATNFLHLISFQNNTISNIGSINVDFGYSAFKPRLLERDVCISSIYGHICILILKFDSSNGFATGLNIFEFPDEKQPFSSLPIFKYLIKFELFGLVGVQIVDNLILIHHKNVHKTLIFDIKMNTNQFIYCSSLQINENLVKCLKERKDKIENISNENNSINSFLYNSAWKMIQNKGFIIDMQFGIFTQIKLNLNKAVEEMKDLENIIQFLINRSNSESVLLNLLKRIILKKEINFGKVTQIIRKILYNPEINNENNSSPQKGKSPLIFNYTPNLVSHNSILRCIFEPLYQHPEVDKKYLANLMIDFFLILKQRKIQIQNHYLPELLLKIVADAKMWTCLQQLLQYRVIDDSKFLAFELISLSDECPSLYQIALDMFNRRGNTDQISEALLCRGHVIDALRFTTANGGGGGFREGGTTICNEGSGSQRLDKICLKLLNSAWICPNDRPLRYTIYSYLQTNGKLKSLAESDDADFERFSRDFHSLYSSEELKEAETSFRLARLSSIRGRNRRDSQREESFCSANSGDVVDILE
uniref:Mic1 domain-containing protein n=1 Tax=Meloidogyne floridensis TaxID=298350 RepID=A0A915NW51_9BILA